MELYTKLSYDIATRLTTGYSTSFSLSSKLFAASLRPHIYAIYGMVRIADEIVDTYRQDDASEQLDEFERQVYDAVATGYSTNPALHAFGVTARAYGIDRTLIEPFFASMRVDLSAKKFTEKTYREYIYGSAEVVGLMCLKVFVDNDASLYERLHEGASALGAAYQKVNFLRDIRADHRELGRMYFPGVTYKSFDEHDKQHIVDDIAADFALADQALPLLPSSSRRAVAASRAYYGALFDKLARASVGDIKSRRIRVPDWYKLVLLARAAVS